MKEIRLGVDYPVHALPIALEKEKVDVLTSYTNRKKKKLFGLINENLKYVVILLAIDIVIFNLYFLLVQITGGKKKYFKNVVITIILKESTRQADWGILMENRAPW